VPKILGKAGDSLADVYDVKGSIAGVEELLSQDVSLVHEMGGVLFSERLSSRVVALASGSIAQSLAFNVNFSFGENSRILALCVITDNVARLNDVQISLTSGPAVDNTEVPIFAWNDANDLSTGINVLLAGSVASRAMLIPATDMQIPNLLVGSDSPRPLTTMSMRGDTTAFGAGTTITTALIYVAFPQVQGLSSRGLPLPGW